MKQNHCWTYLALISLFLIPADMVKSQIRSGDHVPLFSLQDQNGKTFNLKDHLGQKTMIIYFYPKDETKGCTAEACSFRDSYDIFRDNNAEIIGISADNEESHKSFEENHNLPFILLSDQKNKVRNLFGVPKSMLGMLPGRVTYVVDKNGIVQLVFNSQMEFTKHAEEALKIVRQNNNLNE